MDSNFLYKLRIQEAEIKALGIITPKREMQNYAQKIKKLVDSKRTPQERKVVFEAELKRIENFIYRQYE